MSVFDTCSRQYPDTCVCFPLLANKAQRPASAASHACVMVLSWMRGEDWHGSQSLFFVFFTHKKYSRSFIKLQLNHWCHMDYFNNVPATFLGLECGSSIQCQKAHGLHQKYLNFCSEYERMSYRFGTTWGGVINDNFYFWVNYPFKMMDSLTFTVHVHSITIKCPCCKFYF